MTNRTKQKVALFSVAKLQKFRLQKNTAVTACIKNLRPNYQKRGEKGGRTFLEILFYYFYNFAERTLVSGNRRASCKHWSSATDSIDVKNEELFYDLDTRFS
jgi:hypothetical protein